MRNPHLKFIKSLILSLIITITLISIGCNRESKTLVEIGDEKITLGEFEKQYLRTINNVDSARNKPLEDKKQFLNLYINFRLKVKDARERGLLNNSEIQKDIEEYKRTYTPNYLIDKEVVDKEIKKLYDRKHEEVRASHILINLPEKSSPEDSIRAYQTADSIIQRLNNGEDFGDLAVHYSNDRTAKNNRGDLYYFTGGMTVEEFEDAVYNMRIGEYTKQPVRTMFGLHIIKLTDKKPRLESIRASHILIQDKRDSLGNITDSLGTAQLSMDIYNRVKNGEDWNTLVMQFTEDPGTKENGGDLGFFDRRRMTQPFDSAAFLLKIGEIAGPIRTQYGWHIIKKTDEKKYQDLEKQKENLKTEYKRTKKYKDDYAKYVEKIKEEYNFKFNDEGFNFLRNKFDSLKSIADYNLDSLFTQQDKEKIIADFEDGAIKLINILDHLNVNRDFQRTPLNTETIKLIITSSAEQLLLNKKGKDVDIEDEEEYRISLTEYENGLLVFRIDQDELWSKVKLEDPEMLAYYESNKSKYATLDSAGNQIFKPFDQVRAEISNDMQQLKYKEIEKAYLESLRQKYPVTIHEDILLEAFKE